MGVQLLRVGDGAGGAVRAGHGQGFGWEEGALPDLHALFWAVHGVLLAIVVPLRCASSTGD